MQLKFGPSDVAIAGISDDDAVIIGCGGLFWADVEVAVESNAILTVEIVLIVFLLLDVN